MRNTNDQQFAFNEACELVYESAYLLYEGQFDDCVTIQDHVEHCTFVSEMVADYPALPVHQIQTDAYNAAVADFHKHN